MQAAQVNVELAGATAIVRFSNPPHGYIANKGAAQLLEAFTALSADDAVRAIVLTGTEPGVFIRHADVAQIGRAADALVERKIDASAFVQGPFPDLGAMLDASQKPVIAAIDGVCMGGGFEIALACTMRVASAAATSIGLPEIRLGIFPGAGGTQRLQRVLGPHRARLFMLQGEVVDARRALELGLVDEIADRPVERALELARRFSQRPPGAIAAILALTRDGAGALFKEEAAVFAALLQDDPDVRRQLKDFVAGDRRLHELD